MDRGRASRRRRGGGASRRAWIVAAALTIGASACAHARGRAGAPEAAAAWRYTVRPNEALTRLDVELCFDGAPASTLVADLPMGAHVLESARDVETGRKLPVDRRAREIDISSLGRDACLRYGVDLERMPPGRRRLARRVGDAMLLNVSLWLWRPLRLREGASATLEFELPDGAPSMRASTPWATIDGPGERYRVPATTYTWRSQVVLGEFDLDTVTAGGATFSIARLRDPALEPVALTAEGQRRWITTAAETVASLHGRFPVPAVQLIVLPFGRGSSPVAFGLTGRGGGASVVLLISSDASDDDFIGEWVAIHEFLHLSMPYITAEDVWLSEGFVTYYTSVLRTRAGFRDEQAGWEAIVSGLNRARGSVTDLTLREAAAQMNQRVAYDRVYWGGAAVALLSDLALRQESDGRRSLDDAMRELYECCANSPRRWSAAEVYEVFDRWAAAPILSDLLARELDRAKFVDFDRALRALGVEIREDRVVLSDEQPAAGLRQAITGAPASDRAEPGRQ